MEKEEWELVGESCWIEWRKWAIWDKILPFQIDLKHINQEAGEDKVHIGINLREYYPSVEWDILSVPAERHEKYYPCCLEPYIGKEWKFR